MESVSYLLKASALIFVFYLAGLADVTFLVLWSVWTRGDVLFQDSRTPAIILSVVAAAATAATSVLYKAAPIQAVGHSPAASTNSARKPLLFPCMTTHTRLFPKAHSFSYSYLLVGIPVGWSGNAGGMISTAPWARAWYNVNAADHLERGGGHLGLREKLESFLRAQGEEPSEYPHAYLVTAAKFLNYLFNPMSFWHLYSANMEMKAVIVELNNTFDERRIYFLKPQEHGVGLVHDQGAETDQVHTGPLKRTWTKDFHASPFNSRKGTYSIVAHDPLNSNAKGEAGINNTISLTSSKGQLKLDARVFSSGAAVDPEELTTLNHIRFLLSWFWVGLITFPRILKQYALLFFRQKLHIWYRPEPLKGSIARRANSAEQQLEVVFRRYLRHLVDQSSAALAIRYVPSGGTDAPNEIMLSALARERGATIVEEKLSSSNASLQLEESEFSILTPAFYARFVYYAHDLEAVFCEFNDSETLWVSRPQVLPKLVFKRPSPPVQIANYMDYVCFSVIKMLRQRPGRIERPKTSSARPSSSATSQQGGIIKTDIRNFRLSSMDGYVLSQEDKETRRSYRKCVLQLFIADWISLGSMNVFWFEVLVLRIWAAWVLSRILLL